MKLALILFGAGLAASATQAASAAPAVLQMTCHELIGGAPSLEAQHYVLKDDVFTADGVFISSGKYGPLSPDNKYTYVVHVLKGDRLYRDVYSTNKSNQVVNHFQWIYDFGRQRILKDGKDTCHHNGK